MSVPFRELDDPAGPARIAFLGVLADPDGKRITGGVFITNSIGEPVELTWASLTSPASLLCSGARASAHAARLLALALFENCRATPDVLLFREADVDRELFEHRIRLGIPAAVVHPCDGARPRWEWVGDERPQRVGAIAALERLETLDLLDEPFDRAECALNVVSATHPS